MVAANLMRSERRSLLVRGLMLGVLVGACFTSVRETQGQVSAIDYCGQGNDWLKKKDYDRAVADCNQAIRLDPNLVAAYLVRGRAWSLKKEYDRAIADYDQAIKLDPANSVAYCNRGVAWHHKKEYDRAIADCDQAILLNADFAAAYLIRSLAWNDKKEYDLSHCRLQPRARARSQQRLRL